ncbi:DUF883 family protein [Shimia ponticola]|uniref:DUF883 family protein n=1 Tax=Shimia ponticola TaxID=2582893 RepID=UPI00164C2265|nr:DUF883 family protein [Shimia ponticola]
MARAGTNGKAKPDDLNHEIAALRQDVEALTQALTDMGEEKVQDITRRAQDMGRKVSNGASDMAVHTAEAVQAGASNAQRMARENPGATLGIAAGLGFLIGYMTARR